MHLRSKLQGQLSVHFCRASYRFEYTGPVIGPDLQGQLSVQNWGSVIGPFLQSQLSVYVYKASYRSISVSLDSGRFTSQAQMHESQIK